jgi:hypothetical protein
MKNLITIIILLSVVIACVPTSQLYLGKTVDSETVVLLDAMSGKQLVWKTFDLIMTYDYTLRDNVLEISGTGELSQHYQMMYAKIRHLRVYLFLLNEEGSIIQTVLLPSNLINPEDSFSFQIKAHPSEKISALSFGYSGSAHDLYSRAYFYQLPYAPKKL